MRNIKRYILETQYDARQSFYNKATVEVEGIIQFYYLIKFQLHVSQMTKLNFHQVGIIPILLFDTLENIFVRTENFLLLLKVQKNL